MRKTVAFHLNQMSERGTEVSTFDYAKYNQSILKNKSIIIANRKKIFNSFEKLIIKAIVKLGIKSDKEIKFFSKRHRATFQKFTSNFNVFFYDDLSEIDLICKKQNVDFFYVQKFGHKDNLISNFSKNLVHVIFMANEIHGHKYLYISKWLAKTMTGNEHQYVPYIVNKSTLNVKNNLREEFRIPNDAIVVSSYGGKRVFDINFVKETIKEILHNRGDIFFMFLNIEPFYKHPRVYFLPRTIDSMYKSKFINTSDYMIHARRRGETFGLAVGEFSIQNKPIITFSGSKEKAHLEILGDKGITYSTKKELYSILLNLQKVKKNMIPNYYDCYSKHYNPKKVMQLFDQRFLK
jgi:hypothetical protein